MIWCYNDYYNLLRLSLVYEFMYKIYPYYVLVMYQNTVDFALAYLLLGMRVMGVYIQRDPFCGKHNSMKITLVDT